MPSHRKLEANRQNASRSTGPRTLNGKMRSSRNAVRHGLATSFGTNEAEIRNVEKLARILVAERENCSIEMARAAASAQLELIHIRKVRAESWKALVETIDKAEGQSLTELFVNAERLERYERRATSRRRGAFCKLLG